MTGLLTPFELEERLRRIGAERYHDKHPFQIRLQEGRCSKAEVQAWALNRFYYQARIPVKDALVISHMRDPALRRDWRRRLVDHDGEEDGEGGIARWLALTDALGLEREDVIAHRGVLPATRFAVDAYVDFVRRGPLLPAIASSLTELFSPQIIQKRVSGMLTHYDFVHADALAYFSRRPEQAARDSEGALAYVTAHAQTPDEQRAVIEALGFKCDVLWALLDALEHAYGPGGRPPPGAWRPEEGA